MSRITRHHSKHVDLRAFRHPCMFAFLMSNQIISAMPFRLASTILVAAFALVCWPILAQQNIAPSATNGPAVTQPDAALSPDEALEKLLAGNQRFVQDTPLRPDQSTTRRMQLYFSQHPFACVLACSDSRVPPELIFDQGLGNIFVVRVLGNVLDKHALGSVEYAVETLHAPLVLVLGHSRCEVVSAAVSGQSVSGKITEILDALKPAVRAARDQRGDPIEQATKANIHLVVERLKASKPILTEYIKTRKVKIVGGRYELLTGQVDILPQE